MAASATVPPASASGGPAPCTATGGSDAGGTATSSFGGSDVSTPAAADFPTIGTTSTGDASTRSVPGDLFVDCAAPPEKPPVVLEQVTIKVLPGGLLRREDAARFLGLSAHTLACWAHFKFGPPYFRCRRRAYYRLTDLQTWREAQKSW